MPLVEALPYYGEPRYDAPARLDLDGVIVPSDVDLTLVGTIHDGSCSSADYASGLFENHYLLLTEKYGWNPATQKRFQRISRGYSNALETERLVQTDEIEHGSEFEKNSALWNLSVAEALYKSGVRVVMADVSIEDATSGRLADPSTYMGAAARVTVKGTMGLPITEEDLVVFAERDTAIVRAICEEIPKLHREDPKLNSDETLSAVGMYGTAHVQSIADALTTLAAEQDTNSFMVRTRYEVAVPGLDEGVSAPELEMRRLCTAQLIKFYSDWLRTEPTEPDRLWYPDSSTLD